MNKIAKYLQDHVAGEVIADEDVREYFAHDGSVLELTPSIVVYPKNTQDVRKVTRFAWQLAEKGHLLPITARGRGSDQAGGAIGAGIMMVFPAHMNRLLEFDAKKHLARIQPGLNYGAFQTAMHTHGLFLPPYPNSIDFATLGGSIANNASGEKSLKYGATRRFVQSLEVVLANGEVIQTSRLSKKELEHRKGMTSFEGEIYRQVDGLIMDNWDTLAQHAGLPSVTKNAAGYDIFDVKGRDGSFDLTPLFVGSQGTLGVISEAIVRLEPYRPQTTLLRIDVPDFAVLADVVATLLQLGPSALELVDQKLLEFLQRNAAGRLKGVVEPPFPALILLCEFDDQKHQVNKAKKAVKVIEKLGLAVQATQDENQQQHLWSIRHAAGAVMWHELGTKKAVPIIEDGVVPLESLAPFMKGIYGLFEKYHLDVAIWGHAGDSNLHVQPYLDLASLTDRQKALKLMQEYYEMVQSLGGSTTGEHNDGRLRAPFLPGVYGPEIYELFRQVKKIFDPFGTLNPGVKIDVALKDIVPLMRHEYSMKHLADHLPRT